MHKVAASSRRTWDAQFSTRRRDAVMSGRRRHLSANYPSSKVMLLFLIFIAALSSYPAAAAFTPPSLMSQPKYVHLFSSCNPYIVESFPDEVLLEESKTSELKDLLRGKRPRRVVKDKS